MTRPRHCKEIIGRALVIQTLHLPTSDLPEAHLESPTLRDWTVIFLRHELRTGVIAVHALFGLNKQEVKIRELERAVRQSGIPIG